MKAIWRRVARLGAGQIDQHPVHQLDRRGLGFEDGRRRLHRRDELVELEHDQRGLASGPGRAFIVAARTVASVPSDETSSRAGLKSGLMNSLSE